MKPTGAVCLVCLTVFSRLVSAQDLHGLSGFWQPKFGREPFGQVLVNQVPEDVQFINNAGDLELAPGQFAGLALSPRALAQAENYDPNSMQNPDVACLPPSVAFYMQAPFPLDIDEGRDLIVFRMEYYNLVRVIYLDGRDHPPADHPHTKSGHSVGFWDGGTPRVDTNPIAAGTFMNNGFDYADNLHLTEQFRLSTNGNTLWSTQVYEDPETFSGKAARYIVFLRAPVGSSIRLNVLRATWHPSQRRRADRKSQGIKFSGRIADTISTWMMPTTPIRASVVVQVRRVSVSEKPPILHTTQKPLSFIQENTRPPKPMARNRYNGW